MTTSKTPRNRKSPPRVRPKPAAKATLAAAVEPAAEPAAAPHTESVADAIICVQLEPGLEIKDVEGVHLRLMTLLGEGRAVAVDIGRVHTVDTAGAQLLLAFQGEAARRGVAVEIRGESPSLNHTLAVLGLHDKFTFAVPHG